jgi:hypothetical protein
VALGLEEPGEVFAASVLAFESGDSAKIEAVLEVGEKSYEVSRGLVSAFGWIPLGIKNRGRPLAGSVKWAHHSSVGISSLMLITLTPVPSVRAASMVFSGTRSQARLKGRHWGFASVEAENKLVQIAR